MSAGEDISKFWELWPKLKLDDHDIEQLGEGGYATCYSLDDRIVLKKYTDAGIRNLHEQFVSATPFYDEKKLRQPCTLLEREQTMTNLRARLPEPNRFMPKIVERYCKDDILAYIMVKGMTVEDIIYYSEEIEVPLDMKIRIACAIAEPIIYLQGQNRVHGDFTPANIVLRGFEIDHDNQKLKQITSKGKDTKYIRPCAMLIDWDHTQEIPDEDKPHGLFSISRSTSGTAEYQPSEYVSNGRYRKTSETESLAKIWYELFTGEMLCGDARELSPVDMILLGDIMRERFMTLPDFEMDAPEDVQLGIRKTLIRMLQPSYRRPTAEQAVAELRQYTPTPSYSTK